MDFHVVILLLWVLLLVITSVPFLKAFCELIVLLLDLTHTHTHTHTHTEIEVYRIP